MDDETHDPWDIHDEGPCPDLDPVAEEILRLRSLTAEDLIDELEAIRTVHPDHSNPGCRYSTLDRGHCFIGQWLDDLGLPLPAPGHQSNHIAANVLLESWYGVTDERVHVAACAVQRAADIPITEHTEQGQHVGSRPWGTIPVRAVITEALSAHDRGEFVLNPGVVETEPF